MGLALTTTLAATGFVSLLSTARAYIANGPFEEVENCLQPPCGKINEKELIPRVARAYEEFSYHKAPFHQRYITEVTKDPEFLRFRKGDPKEKSLFISAEFDDTGSSNPQHIAYLANEISKNFDFKYMVADSIEKVCAEIEEAAKVGTLNNM